MAARRAERSWGEQLTAIWEALAPRDEAARRLARVLDHGGVVVTTGQQPGLFGGPVYTWSKAASALAVADTLEEVCGIPTAAVFWAATDDADFEEARRTCVLVGGEDVEVSSPHAPHPGTPASCAPLGDLAEQLALLRAAAGSHADSRALDAAQAAYGVPDRTVGGAYVELLRSLLAPLGIAVLDAAHPAVLRASEPVLTQARERAEEIARAIALRTRELRTAGFTPQVDEVDGLSLVFHREGTVKRRLTVAEAAASSGGVHTPNVLLRPIVEREILPTVGYVAGPGELAYFAQLSAVADALQRPIPVALPRWSCTLIEPRVRRLLDRLDITVEAVAHPHALEGRVARTALREGTRAALDDLRQRIDALPRAIEAEAAPLGLTRAVEGAVHALQHRVDRLERRLAAAIKRRGSAELDAVRALRAALHPCGDRQERRLNILPLLARYGIELLEELRRAALPHAQALLDGDPGTHR